MIASRFDQLQAKGTHLCWLVPILLVGLFLRAWPLHESLWVDELHTAWTVSDDFSDVLPRAWLGNNSPLYFWLIYGVTQVTGLHEWGLRAVSLLSGAGLILATFAVARQWHGALSASILAAGLVAIDGNAVYFSSEARTYALVQLVAIAHMSLFWRWLREGESGIGVGTAWFLTAMLLFHLHCTTALVFVAELAAYGIARLSAPQQVRLSPLWLALGFGAVAAGMLPAAGLLREVASRRENWELFVKQRPFLATLNLFPLHTYVLAPLVAVGCLRAGASFLKKDTARDPRDQSGDADPLPLIICASWLIVPLAAAWLLTELDLARLFFRRYVISSSVALAPLTALLLMALTRSGQRAAAAAAVGLLAILTISPAQYARSGTRALSHSSENWRDAIALLADDDGDVPLLLRSGLIEADDWSQAADRELREYCLLPIRGIYRLPDRQAPMIPLPTRLPMNLSEEAVHELARYPRVWLLVRGRRGPLGRAVSVDDVVESVLLQLGHRFTTKRTIDFGGVSLIELVAAEEFATTEAS